MSESADFILAFLEIVGSNPKYNKNAWDWYNLPPFEKMWEIVNNNRREKK